MSNPIPGATGPVTIPVGDARYSTRNTKEAATLGSIGVGMRHTFPITNTYTSEFPASNKKPGEKGWRPGIIEYHFNVTDERGQSIKPLVDAFQAGTADTVYETLLQKLEDKVREEKHLDVDLIAIVDELRKTFYPMLTVYIRRGHENRDRLRDYIYKPKPGNTPDEQETPQEMLLVKRGEGYTFVPKDASPATKKALGL